MGIDTVSLIISAIVSLALGTAALMRNYRSRLCIAFSSLAVALFLHDTMSLLENLDSALSQRPVHGLITLLLGPLALWFVGYTTPTQHGSIKKAQWLLLSTTIILGCLHFLPVYAVYPHMFLAIDHVLFVVPAFLCVFLLARASQATTLTRERLRLRYALWGGVITIGFFLTNALNFAGLNVPPLGTLARTVYFYFLFQTLIHRELMSSEEVVAKIALLGSIALILSSLYLVLMSWVGNEPGLFFFNTFIASFVIIVLFDPIRKLTVRGTRKLFLKSNLLIEEGLERLSRELIGVIEPFEVFRQFNQFLEKSLNARYAALYVLDRDGLSYHCVGHTENKKAIAEISPSAAIVEYMTFRLGQSFVIETIENDRDRDLSEQPIKFFNDCLESMRELGCDAVIPFVHESRLIGFCIVSTGEQTILSGDQLRLVAPMSRQIAQLLQNAEKFAQIRDRDKLVAVGEMAVGLVHEVKNPLGAIRGAVELLREGKEKANEEILKIVIDETDRLSTVLTHFLDYAKPRRHYPQTSCDPIKVIEHTTMLVLRDHKIQLETVYRNPGVNIEADPEVLKQVVLNLLLNAVDALEGHAATPKIKIIVTEIFPKRNFLWNEPARFFKWWESESSPRHPYLEICIEDNGMGIKEEYLSRLFTPFFTTRKKGTGMGLAICRRLVEAMGGTIHVKSQWQQGTAFTIRLPVKRFQESKTSSWQTAKTLPSDSMNMEGNMQGSMRGSTPAGTPNRTHPGTYQATHQGVCNDK